MATPHQVDPGATGRGTSDLAPTSAPGADATPAPRPVPALSPAPVTAPAGRRFRLSLWLVGAGIVASVVVGLAVSTRAGSDVLAGVLAVGAVLRAVLPAPGPEALAVRSRWVDGAALGGLAAAGAVLAQVLPPG